MTGRPCRQDIIIDEVRVIHTHVVPEGATLRVILIHAGEGLADIGAAAESSKAANQTAHDLFGQGPQQGSGGSLRLFIDLLGVGNNPIQGLIFSREAVDPPLVRCVMSYRHVPTRSVLVLEGQHHGLYFHGFGI